ncbi:MAG: MFS transporter [Oscillospiraceae bacterium]|nr:MFS transporter [Oscillospiraceae bacterium]
MNGGGKITKQERSWIMYDWANSVYATIMMAAVYPTYFAGIAGETGDKWWGWATSAAMLLMAVIAPVVGAFADYKGYKKKIFAGFLAVGLFFTLFCAFTDNWKLMLISYALSNVGFSGSGLVYDSFLTDVTEAERMDKISGMGYAFGYIGGSTIPFLMSIALIMFGKNFGIDGAMAVKISLVITVLWWGLFTIPFLKNIHQRHYIPKPEKGILKETFVSIGKTFIKIINYKSVLFFIIAYFFYIDGVGTIIHMSTVYGAVLGLDTTLMILALLVTQIVAFPCAIWFSSLSKKFGSLKMLVSAVAIYMAICIVGFIMGFGLEENWFGIGTGTVLFWVLAVMVGTVQGGIQAISRSHFAKLVPPENSGEFFGFFDILGKFASFMGPALYAFTKDLTGRSSLSILSIVLLFAIALLIFIIKHKTLKTN